MTQGLSKKKTVTGNRALRQMHSLNMNNQSELNRTTSNQEELAKTQENCNH